jgi:glucose/arabinose dehydrogenase
VSRAKTTAACLALLALVLGAAIASPAAAKLKLKKIGRFDTPTYVTSAPGTPGVFVVEQGGRVISINGKKRRVFLDLRGSVKPGGEQGLLSIAFAPDYSRSGLFYAYFNAAGDGAVTIAEFRRASTFKANPASKRVVVSIPHPNFTNHNGGQLQFGPDGNLYAATGDGGGSGDTDNSAQTTDNLLGKLLRIDVRPGASPAAQIVSLGLRNPFRFSFDGNNLVIGDVGQDRFEEIDYLPLAQANGANFGWNDFEGFQPYSGAIAPTAQNTVKPIFAYSHDGGRCSVISGYVSHSKRPKALRGRLLFGDFCDGKLRTLKPAVGGASKVRKLGLEVPSLTSFGKGSGGALYAASQTGPVYRIAGR